MKLSEDRKERSDLIFVRIREMFLKGQFVKIGRISEVSGEVIGCR